MVIHSEFSENQLKTLGLRLQKARSDMNHTGEEIGVALGLDQGTISRYEGGKQKPPTDYLSNFARLANVSFVEEILWSGLAGYIPYTRVPPLARVIDGLDMYCSLIEKSSYPAIIVDYRFGIWAMNAASYNVLRYARTKQAVSSCITLLELAYSDKLGFIDEVTNQRSITSQLQLALFKAFNLNRRHEPFYENYLKFMEARLGIATRGFKEFAQHWKITDIVDDKDNFRLSGVGIEIQGFPFPEIELNMLLYQRIEPTIHLPQFAIIRWEPEESSVFEKYSSAGWFENHGILKLWEVTDAHILETLIEQYNRDNLVPEIKLNKK